VRRRRKVYSGANAVNEEEGGEEETARRNGGIEESETAMRNVVVCAIRLRPLHALALYIYIYHRRYITGFCSLSRERAREKERGRGGERERTLLGNSVRNNRFLFLFFLRVSLARIH